MERLSAFTVLNSDCHMQVNFFAILLRKHSSESISCFCEFDRERTFCLRAVVADTHSIFPIPSSSSQVGLCRDVQKTADLRSSQRWISLLVSQGRVVHYPLLCDRGFPLWSS